MGEEMGGDIIAKFTARDEERFPILKGVKVHPALLGLRLMTEQEFSGLVWSLKKVGLIDPIVTDGDIIIDGRCRFIGCALAGIEPRFEPFKYEGDPDDKDDAIRSYIVDVNIHRRHDGPAAQAIFRARAAAEYPDYPPALVSPEAVFILRYEDIASWVTDGLLSLAKAYDLALERDREIAKQAKDQQRLVQLRAADPFAAALVDEGTLTLDQGLARAEETAAAPLIAEHVQAIRRIGRRMMADALEIGRRLAECRRFVRRDWIGWLDRELGLTDRSALNFIRIHELASARSENFADLDLPVSGLYLLAQPSTPDAVRDEVLQRAAAGEAISFSDIKREVSGERPASNASLSGLAKIARQLADERPEDALVRELQALISKMANRKS